MIESNKTEPYHSANAVNTLRNRNMPINSDIAETNEYKNLLRYFHIVSPRHVLVLEAELSEDDKRHIFRDAELLRQCGNELAGIMNRNLEQLFRTKRYRNLRRLYGKYSDSKDKAEIKNIASQMNEMREQYHVTWDFCRSEMIRVKNKYGVPSIFALTRAEDIWSAIEDILYSDGNKMHFRRRGDLPDIRAKQINRGIIVKIQNGRLWFSYNGVNFTYKDDDRFVDDETSAVINYLSNSEVVDYEAVQTFAEDGCCMNTYRPCYASLICKTIRRKLRVFIHLTIEGYAMPKYDRFGNPRHVYGKGRVGCDIGTQTYAYTSETETGLYNLAERGSSIKYTERQERLLLRKMERSRRAMNPDNYNNDGTVRKGKKVWHNSKRYLKLRMKHQELCRKAAKNRRLSINEDVNHLRSLGDVLITEPGNFKALQKKAKPPAEFSPEQTEASKKPKRRKRFGKSIKSRCPGYMHAELKTKFESTGGCFCEVPNDYRASQYDHTADDYTKKKLSERIFKLADGTEVQRDWYSSFLLFCADDTMKLIDRDLCLLNFPEAYKKEQVLIKKIACSGIKIFNSGIKNVTG